mmetsp:Transcript_1837/g.8217  ORF Transcript_1837/g.8217 Transcript_1837/m.8217 type:complete len:274 (+) Transcript_1837:1866-2687(+)
MPKRGAVTSRLRRRRQDANRAHAGAPEEPAQRAEEPARGAPRVFVDLRPGVDREAAHRFAASTVHVLHEGSDFFVSSRVITLQAVDAPVPQGAQRRRVPERHAREVRGVHRRRVRLAREVEPVANRWKSSHPAVVFPSLVRVHPRRRVRSAGCGHPRAQAVPLAAHPAVVERLALPQVPPVLPRDAKAVVGVSVWLVWFLRFCFVVVVMGLVDDDARERARDAPRAARLGVYPHPDVPAGASLRDEVSQEGARVPRDGGWVAVGAEHHDGAER